MASALLPLSRTNFGHPSTSILSSPYRRPSTIISVAQNQCYLDSIHSDIESHLKKIVKIRHPVSVFEPMHHLTFSPPRTAAAALCIAACELVGGERDDALVTASAIHLMHAAAYVHEHLPLTDRVVFEPKHGSEPETPHVFGPNIELLTGDGMFSLGFELLAGPINPDSNNSDKMLKVIIEIGRAIGVQGMIEQLKGQPSPALHECGAACGAILGGGSEEEIKKLKSYGFYVGMIHALLYGVKKSEGVKMELVDKWRGLALKELEYFDRRKIEQISRIVSV